MYTWIKSHGQPIKSRSTSVALFQFLLVFVHVLVHTCMHIWMNRIVSQSNRDSLQQVFPLFVYTYILIYTYACIYMNIYTYIYIYAYVSKVYVVPYMYILNKSREEPIVMNLVSFVFF